MNPCRQMINALLPPGSLWSPEDGGDFDKLLDGVATNLDSVRISLKTLARVRCPKETPVLSDLEREFGIVPDTSTDESIRRARLLATKTSRGNDGSLDFLQGKLRSVGFDVYVHANNPPVDPGFFLNYAPSAICGNSSALCGASATGAKQGELLVNGPLLYEGDRVRYDVPVPPQYWPLVFFVGGEATRNGAGELQQVATAVVPVDRRAELANFILRLKPLHSWAGLSVKYI